ncbi:hypothetical protein O181_080511 [Austropuccinia psidii MF-1]|uniref:Uncharacterized protein n=1 Tax=Austropuccinia psidii MF-1 TaxID=1389203 RepID=A0A9Q3FIC7_9BASI|nr:hypothetical protein [Austropuccinia psidii MF-1]
MEAIEIYQSWYKKWFREAKEEEWEICSSHLLVSMNSYFHIKSFLGQEKTIEVLGGWSPMYWKEKVNKIRYWLKNQSLSSVDQKKKLEMIQDFENERTVEQTRFRTPQRQPQGTSEKEEKSQSIRNKGKCKVNQHRTYPQGYKIPKLEPSSINSVLNMTRTPM